MHGGHVVSTELQLPLHITANNAVPRICSSMQHRDKGTLPSAAAPPTAALAHLGVGVELEHGAQVLERVLLEGLVLDGAGLGGADHRLDLIAAMARGASGQCLNYALNGCRLRSLATCAC